MSSNISNSSLMNLSFVRSTNEKVKKDEQKEREHLQALCSVLQDISETLVESTSGEAPQNLDNLTSDLSELSNIEESGDINSTASTKQKKTEIVSTNSSSKGSTSSTTDAYVPPAGPSSKEIEEAIASLNVILGELDEEYKNATDQAYKDSIKMMEAMITADLNVLNNYLNAMTKAQNDWKNYQDFMNQYGKYDNCTIYTDGSRWGSDYYIFITIFDSNGNIIFADNVCTDDIDSAIEKWVKDNLGIDIHLNRKNTDLKAIKADADAQVKAGLDAEINSAESALNKQFLYSSNPFNQAIGNFIYNESEFNSEAMKQLELLMNEMLEVMTFMNGVEFSNSEGPTNDMLMKMLAIMSATIGNLEQMISKDSSYQASMSSKMSQASIESAQEQLDEAKKQLEHLKHEMARQKRNSTILKAITYTASAVAAIGCLAMGQVELAVMIIAVTVTTAALEESGAMNMAIDKLSSLISDLLVSQGESRDQANKDARVIAQAVVVVAVLCFCLMAGGALGASGFITEAAETATETAAEAAIEASSASEAAIASEEMTESNLSMMSMESDLNDAASSSKTLAEKALYGAKKSFLNSFLIGLQTAMSNNMAFDAIVAGLSATTHKDDKEIQKEAMIGSIVVNASLTVAMLGCAALSASTATSAAETATTESSAASIARTSATESENASDTANNPLHEVAKFVEKNPKLITNIMNFIMFSSGVIEAGAYADLSASKAAQAKAERKLGDAQAEMTLYQDIAKRYDALANQFLANARSTLSDRQNIDNSMFKNMLAYEGTYAQIILHAV